MKFMMFVKADKDYEAGLPPSPALMQAVGQLAAKQAQSGVLVAAGGLLPSAHGARVDVANGCVTVTDGPFSETKELVGGYAMNAASREEAIELGREFMQLHADVLGPSWQGQLEIRPLADVGGRS